MYCPHCGTYVEEASRFCGHCGNALPAPAQPADASAMPPMQQSTPDYNDVSATQPIAPASADATTDHASAPGDAPDVAPQADEQPAPGATYGGQTFDQANQMPTEPIQMGGPVPGQGTGPNPDMQAANGPYYGTAPQDQPNQQCARNPFQPDQYQQTQQFQTGQPYGQDQFQQNQPPQGQYQGQQQAGQPYQQAADQSQQTQAPYGAQPSPDQFGQPYQQTGQQYQQYQQYQQPAGTARNAASGAANAATAAMNSDRNNPLFRELTTPNTIKTMGVSLGIGLAAALVVALLATVLIIAGSSSVLNDLLSEISPGVFGGSGTTVGGSNFLQILVLMLIAGVSGSFGLSVNVSGFSAGAMADASLALPLGLSGVALLVGTAFGAYWFTRKVGVRFKWTGAVSAAIVGVATGLVYVILGALFPISVSMSESSMAVSASFGGATARTFVMAFLVAALGALAGYFLAQYAPDSSNVFVAAWRWAHRTRGFVRTVVESVAVYTVVFTVLAIITMIVLSVQAETGMFLLLIPLLFPFLPFMEFVLASLGALSITASDQSVSLALYSSENPLPVWVTVVLIVVFVLATLYIALRASARNIYDRQYANWRHSWKSPLVAAVLWLVLSLSAAQLACSVSAIQQISVSVNVGPAVWYFLLAAVWAFLIEVVALTFGPSLVAMVPALWPMFVGGTVQPTPQSVTDYVVASGAVFARKTANAPTGGMPGANGGAMPGGNPAMNGGYASGQQTTGMAAAAAAGAFAGAAAAGATNVAAGTGMPPAQDAAGMGSAPVGDQPMPTDAYTTPPDGSTPMADGAVASPVSDTAPAGAPDTGMAPAAMPGDVTADASDAGNGDDSGVDGTGNDDHTDQTPQDSSDDESGAPEVADAAAADAPADTPTGDQPGADVPGGTYAQTAADAPTAAFGPDQSFTQTGDDAGPTYPSAPTFQPGQPGQTGQYNRFSQSAYGPSAYTPPDASYTQRSATAAVPPMAPAARRKPLSTKQKVVIIVIGVVAVIAVALGIAYAALNATLFSPTHLAEEYISAISSGEYDKANELADPQIDEAQRVLLADQAAQAENATISNARVTSVQDAADGSKIVDVSYTINGSTVEDTFSMASTGKQYLVFPDWTITTPLLKQITVYATASVTELEINGITVTQDNAASYSEYEGLTFYVYPGVYRASVADSTYLTSDTTTLDTYISSQGYIEAEPTEELTEELQSAVDELLQTCVASTEADPDGCPFGMYTYSSSRYRNFAWSLATSPSIDYVYLGSGTFSADYGEAQVTYEYQDYTDTWDAQDYTDSFYISGSFEIDGDEVNVTFDEDYW